MWASLPVTLIGAGLPTTANTHITMTNTTSPVAAHMHLMHVFLDHITHSTTSGGKLLQVTFFLALLLLAVHIPEQRAGLPADTTLNTSALASGFTNQIPSEMSHSQSAPRRNVHWAG